MKRSNYRKVYLICILGVCTLILCAGEYAPARTTVKKARVYQQEKYALSEQAAMANALNQYTFTLVQSKPSGNTPPRTQFWLSAEHFGFSPLVNFLKINVNGIPNANLSPAAKDLTLWQEKNLSGCETKLNFDGVKLILRLYMRPDSPVLWGSIRPDSNSLEPLKSMTVTFTALVSTLVRDDKKTPIWGGVYQRMAITPKRTLEQRRNVWELAPEENSVILQDKKFDGSSADKGQGPVLILLSYDGVAKAELALRDEWITSLNIVLNPDFKVFRFGLWQRKNAISNQDFLALFEKEKDAFLLK